MDIRAEYPSTAIDRPLVRIIWRSSTNEFRISVDGLGEAAAYYTSSPADVAGTAEQMKRLNGAERIIISSNAQRQMRALWDLDPDPSTDHA